MATAAPDPTTRTPTLSEVLPSGIPPERILMHPTPGTATADDLTAIHQREGRLCELINGSLVEKTMGSHESILASRLIYLLLSFIDPRNLGEVLAPDGMIWTGREQVRLPDLAYYSYANLPGGVMPDQAILSVIPELVVEIISKGNTKKEMRTKLREYFDAGVQIVWYAEPKKRLVSVYEAVDRVTILDHTGTLTGGAVLPGLAIPVAAWLR